MLDIWFISPFGELSAQMLESEIAIFFSDTLPQCTGNTIILYSFGIFLADLNFGVLFLVDVIALMLC